MKVFNGILGVFALFGAVYCMLFPGLSFLNNGWIVAILLGMWGVAAIFDFFTKEKKENRSKAEAAMGVLSFVLGIGASFVSLWAIFTPNLTALLIDFVIVYILAGWMIFGGVASVFEAIMQKKSGKSSVWIVTLIWGILFTLCGVMGLMRPLIIAWMVQYFVAALLILYGIRLLSSIVEKEA